MQFAQRQRRKQTKCVDMAAMIRNDDERAIGPQIVVSYNFKMIVDVQQASNDQCAERPQSVNEHVWLARKLTQTIDRRSIDITRRVVEPFFHRSG